MSELPMKPGGGGWGRDILWPQGSRWRGIVWLLVIFGAYLGVVVLYPYLESGGVALLWLPNAVLATALLRFRTRDWPYVYAVALAAEVVGDLTFGVAPHHALYFGAVNAVEATLFTLCAAVIAGDRSHVGVLSVRGALSVVLAAVLVPGFTGAMGAIGSVWTFDAEYLTAWRNWWFGDALGLLVGVPIGLLLRDAMASVMRRRSVALSLGGGGAAGLLFVVAASFAGAGNAWGAQQTALAAAALLALTFGAVGAPAGVVLTTVATLIGLARREEGLDSVAGEQSLLFVVFAAVYVIGATTESADRAMRHVSRARDDLETANAQLSSFLEGAPDAWIIAEPDGCIVRANAQADRLFGYTRDDLVGGQVERLLSPRFRGNHIQLRRDFFADPKARMMGTGTQLWGLRRDGTEFPVDINLSPLRTGKGLQVLAAIRDVTERHQAAAQIVEKNQELQRSNEDLERFAYIASHDLREPLRHITSFVQKLEEKYGGSFDERGQRYLGYVVDASQRMRQLIDGLLEFSRVGRSSPQLSPLDLGAVVDAASKAVSVLAQDRGATVEVGPLPEVLGDEDLLFRLFVNLLANAIKFACPERLPYVAVTAKAGEGGLVEVCVSDNGIGIEEKYRERAFEIFERLNGDKYPGTGMGLSVARRIVDAHGGSIALDETDGGGTTVRIELRTPSDTGEKEVGHR